MEKLSVKEAAETRANLYAVTREAIENAGLNTEPIKGGVLIALPDGYFAKMAISICDATKFDVEEARSEYQAQLKARAEAAEKALAKEAEKAAKAAAKAAKEAEKADKVAE